MEDEDGAEKVRATFAAFSTAAVAEGAVGGVVFLAGVEGFLGVVFIVFSGARETVSGALGWRGLRGEWEQGSGD
jgi:hypothetical protein